MSDPLVISIMKETAGKGSRFGKGNGDFKFKFSKEEDEKFKNKTFCS